MIHTGWRKPNNSVGPDYVPVPITLFSQVEQEVLLLVIEVLPAVIVPLHAFMNGNLNWSQMNPIVLAAVREKDIPKYLPLVPSKPGLLAIRYVSHLSACLDTHPLQALARDCVYRDQEILK